MGKAQNNELSHDRTIVSSNVSNSLSNSYMGSIQSILDNNVYVPGNDIPLETPVLHNPNDPGIMPSIEEGGITKRKVPTIKSIINSPDMTLSAKLVIFVFIMLMFGGFGYGMGILSNLLGASINPLIVSGVFSAIPSLAIGMAFAYPTRAEEMLTEEVAAPVQAQGIEEVDRPEHSLITDTMEVGTALEIDDEYNPLKGFTPKDPGSVVNSTSIEPLKELQQRGGNSLCL
jgi:hypothetical protein